MGSIVEFPVRVPDEGSFCHEETRKLYGTWLGEARRGRHPRLSAFAPGRLGRWLSWVGLVEPTDDGESPLPGEGLRWRLAGSSLCRLAAHELDGAPLFANWPRFERSVLERMVARTLRHGYPFVARLDLGSVAESAGLELEMLALPFDDGRHTVVLLFFRPSSEMITPVPGALEQARMVSLRTLALPEPPAAPGNAPAGDSAQILHLLSRRNRSSG